MYHGAPCTTCTIAPPRARTALARWQNGDYDKVLQLDPSHLDGYFGRAQTYYEMRLLTRAIADCEHVLQIESCHRPARELVKCIRREIF